MKWIIAIIIILLIMGKNRANKVKKNARLRDSLTTHIRLFPEMTKGKSLRQIIKDFCILHSEFETKYFNLYTPQELSSTINL